VAAWLGRLVPVRTTENFRGAVWSKLLLNCSVTTIGALAGETMRAYIMRPAGRALFDRTYAEALAVARASGATPERMLVEPVPPPGAYGAWLSSVVASYGDLKASMLQDFERGRRTEVDFINGYVCDVGRRLGVPTPANAEIVEKVHAIEAGRLRPSPASL
jgi:2-dehydropantoate 2-reductase